MTTIFEQALERYAIPDARDGDCEIAEEVTAALITEGLPARTVTIACWVDQEHKILAFLHLATACGDTILDGTLRQFDPDLPAGLIATRQNYLATLETATGNPVTVWK